MATARRRVAAPLRTYLRGSVLTLIPSFSAAFDFHFGSLDSAETELAKLYANLL
jgi:hypothetical protein